MADKNKKGVEIKEYPKLVKVGEGKPKVRVNSAEEEATLNLKSSPAQTPKGWGEK